MIDSGNITGIENGVKKLRSLEMDCTNSSSNVGVKKRKSNNDMPTWSMFI